MRKVSKFYQIWVWSAVCSRLESNYSSCTGSSSESICSSNGGGSGQTKDRMKLSFLQKLMVFWISPRFLLNLTPSMTTPKVLVLCFPSFPANSIILHPKYCVHTIIHCQLRKFSLKLPLGVEPLQDDTKSYATDFSIAQGKITSEITTAQNRFLRIL